MWRSFSSELINRPLRLIQTQEGALCIDVRRRGFSWDETRLDTQTTAQAKVLYASVLKHPEISVCMPLLTCRKPVNAIVYCCVSKRQPVASACWLIVYCLSQQGFFIIKVWPFASCSHIQIAPPPHSRPPASPVHSFQFHCSDLSSLCQ